MTVWVRLYFKPSGLRCEMTVTPLEWVLGRDSWSRSRWLTAIGSFVGFQCCVELGRGDDKDGCRLVTTAGRSRLGVAGDDASRVSEAADQQLLRGRTKAGGFPVCSQQS